MNTPARTSGPRRSCSPAAGPRHQLVVEAALFAKPLQDRLADRDQRLSLELTVQVIGSLLKLVVIVRLGRRDHLVGDVSAGRHHDDQILPPSSGTNSRCSSAAVSPPVRLQSSAVERPGRLPVMRASRSSTVPARRSRASTWGAGATSAAQPGADRRSTGSRGRSALGRLTCAAAAHTPVLRAWPGCSEALRTRCRSRARRATATKSVPHRRCSPAPMRQGCVYPVPEAQDASTSWFSTRKQGLLKHYNRRRYKPALRVSSAAADRAVAVTSAASCRVRAKSWTSTSPSTRTVRTSVPRAL